MGLAMALMPSNRLDAVDKIYLDVRMKPLNNYVTLELIEESSSIIQLSKPTSPKGKVTGIGTKVKSDIKIGDVVYYRARTSAEYQGNVFIEESEILGRVV